MDSSSKHHMGTEECSSSESGWTMYIASPMEEDGDDDCSYDVIENYHYPVSINGKDEQDSDDSMASDASSGPHHHPKQQSYQDHGGKTTPKSGNSFNHCSSAAKQNKKEKKNHGTSNFDKNRKLPSNRKYSK